MQILDAHAVGDRVKCAHCQSLFPRDEVQVDHILPEHRGGGHEPENLQPLCYPKSGPSCHKEKSAEEAGARATARRRANRNPIRVIIPALTASAGGYLLYLTYLQAQGRPIAPALHLLHQVTMWWNVVLLALYLAYGLAHASFGQDDTPEVVKPTGETPAQRIAAAVRAEMGDKGYVKVYPTGTPTDGAGRLGFKVTYRSTDFADRDDNAKLKVQERISAKMGGRWRCDWNEQEDWFYTEKRPELPARIDHPGIAPGKPWHLLPIGPSTIVNLKVAPHVLVIGATLAGKTSIFRSMIIACADAAAKGEIELILFDPKRVELIGFRGWPGIKAVLTEDDQMYGMPMEIEREMERRQRAVEHEGAKVTEFTPWIVIIDEYREYVKRMGRYSIRTNKRKTISSPIEPIESIATLLAMARKLWIHIIIGTQRPDAKWFGGDARDNCPGRISVGPLSRDAAMMLYGKATVGRDIPLELKGRFTYQMNEGGYAEDQGFFVPDPTDAEGENTEQDWALLHRLGMP
jgi:hypothetical protein